MNPWVLILAALAGLILLYALFFYLASIVQQGSPFRIWLSYLGPRIRSRLTLYIPRRNTEEYQRSLYPKDLPVPKDPDQPKPSAPVAHAKKPAPKPTIRKPVPLPATLTTMAAPRSGPLPSRIARQLADEQRRVWVKYLNEGQQQVEDKVEIYSATAWGHLHVWFCFKRKRDTLPRNRIVAWQILAEHFERSPAMEQWARRASLAHLVKRLRHIFTRQP
ncbi:MAG: hypothetical protein KGO52_03670 [Nitrospirota bacterium]|nr:hypothetical protein [Nitrospirota bacterium]MDE3118459.1 hypothetical protein [Nitrospirota bacterium]MDE3226179.1 hypothetical protein [Nitrospirota bacterium]MDE3241804.1 hypothetical protein [Nitrospirota bacterium]